jgi:hypothetical protein
MPVPHVAGVPTMQNDAQAVPFALTVQIESIRHGVPLPLGLQVCPGAKPVVSG